MVVFVFGGSKSGKSNFAQNVSVKISNEKDLYYLATMIPYDEEDELRIKKHVTSRAGLGFKTLECAYDLNEVFDDGKINPDGSFLVESLTSLLSNIMFKNLEPDFNAWPKLDKMLRNFIQKSKNSIFVCDSIFADAEEYGAVTETFRQVLAKAACLVCELSDVAVEVKNGQAYFIKGGDGILQKKNDLKKYYFITGGAYNGKLDYAKKRFGLSDDDISFCDKNSEPDFSKRCVAYLENYVCFCLRNKIQPRTDWKADTIFICTDIFCGVVPVDKDLREWREKTGEYFQLIADQSSCVRVCFGIPQEMGGGK
ncbi:MAG: bifunctional adenosylcobinamide kinase/adenosylcobinamide-phosphate guanylyltransferase [Treponema sp.]|nr:bifunctional adenosylcobinamide kinase/adenosylcobinamide-phosphate guanylyltransferase [Treponema sp.]